MHVQDIMTQNPTCCGPDATVQAAAKLMMENDCGEIPVLDDNGIPIGVITDRDIACRCVAEGKTNDTRVSDVMSSPVVTVTPATSLADCCAVMEENQITASTYTNIGDMLKQRLTNEDIEAIIIAFQTIHSEK